MKTILYKGSSRGHANHGWLDTWHTFSFANYYDPSRIHFGALRVLNDDYIEGGEGFGRHPHDNMEITTIVLEGRLEHKDSMGHTQQIRTNEVQVMSAGTGIFHSEYNADSEATVNLFQVWIFPSKKNITPRYDQKEFDPALRLNRWQILVAPDQEGALMLNQDAWFSRIALDKGKAADYELHDPSHGVYIMMINGTADVEGTRLETRDGIGVSDTLRVNVKAETASDILLIEVPMQA